MESVVDDIMNQLTSGTEEQKRKYSEGLSLGNNKKNSKFGKQLQQTIRQRHQTYKEKKKPNVFFCITNFFMLSLCNDITRFMFMYHGSSDKTSLRFV